jgi:FtsP/CotA-like multicopper oxidase with cupredoxin domain
MKLTRRQFAKLSALAGAGTMLPLRFLPAKAFAAPAAAGLSDPALQPKFVNAVPDALAPGFIYQPDRRSGEYSVTIAKAKQATGLIDPVTGKALKTNVWGYGDAKDGIITWPGRTFQVKSVGAGGPAETVVNWYNGLNPVKDHLLPVDTNLHWCYSLHGYTGYTIADAGVPIITHLHGGHSDFQFDGNPEFFYGTPGRNQVVGPQWANVQGGFTTKFRYDNDVRAGNLWYHDHALGITRLNVYAGLAGFYFVRDEDDTGLPVEEKRGGNTLDLPAWPYEKAYAIQDRMFRDTGELFYPAFPGEPFYDDFITGEGAVLPPDLFPGGGPTALAEFFGDHMVVNGVIWPYEAVEPRNYRLHLLNGTDSRFMAVQFVEVQAGATGFTGTETPIPFDVIGSDQGLASSPTTVETLVFEPGSRYDIIFDFKKVTPGSRVIMKNIGGDEPFGGDIPGPQIFSDTDKIMAFDVVLPLSRKVADVSPTTLGGGPSVGTPTRTRKVALFEGKDEFGRLQPLLGTAEPAKDYANNSINWPNTPVYSSVGLTGPMEGSIAWHSPTTENPALNTTEEWEIWNVTGDAHPVHLHLVHFEVLGREEIQWDSNTIGPDDPSGEEEDRVIPNALYSAPAGDGTYLVTQTTVQHNSVAGDASTYGMGFRIVTPTGTGTAPSLPEGYVENTPKDMVTALPGQITRIKAKFDKPGRYVWHCHILSHEDHEMMRVLHVGPGA